MMILSTRTAIWLRVGNDDHDLGPEMDGPCNDKKCGRGGDIYVCVHIHTYIYMYFYRNTILLSRNNGITTILLGFID